MVSALWPTLSSSKYMIDLLLAVLCASEDLCDRAGRCTRFRIVRTAREDDRHSRAEHDARGYCVREIFELFRDHVAGLEIRHEQDLRPTCNLGADSFRARRGER